jgi:hypothetical protein
VRIDDGSAVGETRRDLDQYRGALADPDALEALRVVYRGRWDVADALRWACSPDSATPDGRSSPSVRLRELQRRAFAADGDAAGDESVARAISALEAEITAERAALDAALLIVRGTVDSPPAGAAVVRESARPARPGQLAAPAPVSDRETPGVSSRRRGVLAVTFAGAVAVGAVLGGNLTAALTAATNPAAGPAVVPTGDPVPETDQDVLVSRVFDSVQTPKDIPLPVMPDDFVPESFRYLGSAGWTDVDSDGVTDSPYYAARGVAGTVCLVVVPADSGYLSTCALESAYPAAGLRLSWQSRDLHPDTSDPLDEMVLDISVAWLSDATVQTRGSGRPVTEP